MKPGDMVLTKIDIDSIRVDDPEKVGIYPIESMIRVPRETVGIVLELRTTNQPTYGSNWIKWVASSGLVGWSYAVAFRGMREAR